MKKRITLFTLIAVLTLTFVLAVAPVGTGLAREAAKRLVKDDFNNTAFVDGFDSDKWAKYGDEQSKIAQSGGNGGNTLMFRNGATGDNVVAYTTEKYQIESVTFDVNMGEGFTGWTSVAFASSTTNASIYKAPFFLNSNQITNVNGGDPKNIDVLLGEYNSPNNVAAHAHFYNTWLTIKLDITSAHSFDVYVARQGSAFGTEKASYTISDTKDAMDDAHVLFGVAGLAEGATCEFDNVKIVTKDTTDQDVTENFEGEKSKVAIVNRSGSSKVYAMIYSKSVLQFNGAPLGARVVSKEAAAVDKSILSSYEVINATFTVKVTTGKVGFMFGLSGQDDYSGKNIFVYEISASGGELKNYSDGASIATNAFTSVGGDLGAVINVTVNKNGKVTVTENGEKVSSDAFVVSSYAGYVGFNAVTDNTVATIDDVNVTSRTYFAPETKSLTNNFSTDYLGGEGTLDFFLTATPQKTLTIENGKLNWTGCSDKTLFGPTYEYDDFILDYKITDIKVCGCDRTVACGCEDATATPRWFGLDIGRTAYDIGAYGSYLMLYFNITNLKDRGTTQLTAFTTSGVEVPESMKIENHKQIPMSLFEAVYYDGAVKGVADVKEGDAVCVRWVAENNVLKLYMKKASETDFVHYTTVTGIETNGHLALCCTGYTYLGMDDFSIANTSTVYQCASNEAPEKQIIEVEPEYDYNKYIDSGTLKDELNYLEGKGGCNSSVSGSILIPSVVALAVAGVVIFARRRKDEKDNF